MHRLILYISLAFLLATACQPIHIYSNPASSSPNLKIPRKTETQMHHGEGVQLGQIVANTIYCSPNGRNQYLDLYFPAEKPAKAWPLVVYIHGGAWQEGDKESARYWPFVSELTENGIVVASINYRLAPEYKFPAQIEDSCCAIRFLKANAERYLIDPDRVGVIGDSAGGHLAALVALASSNLTWKTTEYSEYDENIQAVVDLYGVSDLTRVFENDGSFIWPRVFDVKEKKDSRLISASPVTYVRPQSTAFLIIHGDHDTVVPFEQSQLLFEALNSAGNTVELIEVKNADHGFSQVGYDPVEPDTTVINKRIVEFFRISLK